ncbi:MAG: hypothetical protein IJ223_04725 [Clostridia bacterium]|nr:hypothetical protein [Clostridia bacterium]
MVLVFLLIIILFLNILTCFTYIKINLKELYITNIPDYKFNFDLNFEFWLFNKFRISKININERKIKNSKFLKDITSKIKLKPANIDLSKSKKILKKLELNLESFNSNLSIGTEDAVLTSFLSTLISSVIGIILR